MILGWGAKIPHVFWPVAKETKKKRKQRQYCNKFNKDLKKQSTSKKKKQKQKKLSKTVTVKDLFPNGVYIVILIYMSQDNSK